jgi:hypothetical protein
VARMSKSCPLMPDSPITLTEQPLWTSRLAISASRNDERVSFLVRKRCRSLSAHSPR